MYGTVFSNEDWTRLQNLWLAHVTKAHLGKIAEFNGTVFRGCMLLGNYLSVGNACY